MKKKPSDVPVFVVYAGIIHAIALALILPMLIALPGRDAAPQHTPAKVSAVDVVVLPAAETLVDIGPDQTSSLPSPSGTEEGAARTAAPEAAEPKPAQETKDSVSASAPAVESQTEPIGASEDALPSTTPSVSEPNQAIANVAPAAEPAAQAPEPQAAKPSLAERPAKTTTATTKTETAKPAPPPPKKAIAQQTRPPSPPPSRRLSANTAKNQTKFTPFNGFLSGMFGPPTAKAN